MYSLSRIYDILAGVIALVRDSKKTIGKYEIVAFAVYSYPDWELAIIAMTRLVFDLIT